MKNYSEIGHFMKSFASPIRVEILDLIQKGVNNPGLIAQKMNKHRSTIEKHIRILLNAKAVKKTPALSEKGTLSITYILEKNTIKIIETINQLIE